MSDVDEQIETWMRKLYVNAGIQTVAFRDGVRGLVNVPGKYVAVIDAMHQAMTALAHGDPLPEFVAPPPKRKR